MHPGHYDIDDGLTLLTSPAFDLSEVADPHLSYWRWWATGFGNPARDDWVVEASTDDGATWPFELERVPDGRNEWTRVIIRLSDHLVPSSAMRFRFTASDLDAPALNEAALDDFMIFRPAFPFATTAPDPAPSPVRLTLGAAAPNPVRGGRATFDLTLPRDASVKAILFDVTGRRVRTLIDGGLPAGAHRLIWDGRNSTGESVASGVYFLRFDGDGEKRFRKVLILR